MAASPRATATTFLETLFQDLREDERAVLCAFVGDPADRAPNAWRPRPWRSGAALDIHDDANAYVCISTFAQHNDGTWRRRQDRFARAHVLMIDDVGDGPGSKQPLSVIERLPPTFLVETSPRNYQAWYALRPPVKDRAAVQRVIAALIRQAFLGNDPGMSGVNRVGRLPGYVNGKPQYNGWRCRVVDQHAAQFKLEDFVRAFNLELVAADATSTARTIRLNDKERAARIDAFRAHYAFLRSRAHVLSETADPSGWIQIVCPWADAHTAGPETGAAIRKPAEENGWHGAFRCHHGHCADKAWRDLTEWTAERAAEELEVK